MTIVIAITGIVLSGLAIFPLCLGDPKRRRAMGRRDEVTSRFRPLLVAGACVPGLAFALLGDSAALVLWLGGVALLGWLAATCFSEPA